jgi:hypothetical protein
VPAARQSPDIIEGSFRVVAERAPPRRASPNRRRAAARIALWNTVLMLAVVAIPILL